jgi:hypothetical protein
MDPFSSFLLVRLLPAPNDTILFPVNQSWLNALTPTLYQASLAKERLTKRQPL